MQLEQELAEASTHVWHRTEHGEQVPLLLKVRGVWQVVVQTPASKTLSSVHEVQPVVPAEVQVLHERLHCVHNPPFENWFWSQPEEQE